MRFIFFNFTTNNNRVIINNYYCGNVIIIIILTIFCFRFSLTYNLLNDFCLAMYEEAEKWVRDLGHRKFMGGSTPNLADLVSEWLYDKP